MSRNPLMNALERSLLSSSITTESPGIANWHTHPVPEKGGRASFDPLPWEDSYAAYSEKMLQTPTQDDPDDYASGILPAPDGDSATDAVAQLAEAIMQSDLQISNSPSSRVTKARRAAWSRLYLLRSLRAPITRVPDDLLGVIFETVNDVAGDCLAAQNGISHVSSRWRGVAINRGALWRKISAFGPAQLHLVTMALERSKLAPIDLELYDLHDSKESWPLVSQIIDDAACHLVSLKVRGCDQMMAYLSSREPIPTLTALHMWDRYEMCHQHEQVPAHPWRLLDSPNLEYLDFNTHVLPITCLQHAFSSLKRLRLQFTNYLDQTKDVSQAQFSSFLQSCPSLVYLEVLSVRFSRDHGSAYQSVPGTNLPGLRDLRMRKGRYLSWLQTLSAPSLSRLVMDMSEMRFTPMNQSASLADVFNERSTAECLRDLFLRLPNHRGADILPLLSKLPNLRRLRVVGGSSCLVVCQALAEKVDNVPCLLPSLKDFGVVAHPTNRDADSTLEAFKEVVSSRHGTAFPLKSWSFQTLGDDKTKDWFRDRGLQEFDFHDGGEYGAI